MQNQVQSNEQLDHTLHRSPSYRTNNSLEASPNEPVIRSLQTKMSKHGDENSKSGRLSVGREFSSLAKGTNDTDILAHESSRKTDGQLISHCREQKVSQNADEIKKRSSDNTAFINKNVEHGSSSDNDCLRRDGHGETKSSKLPATSMNSEQEDDNVLQSNGEDEDHGSGSGSENSDIESEDSSEDGGGSGDETGTSNQNLNVTLKPNGFVRWQPSIFVQQCVVSHNLYRQRHSAPPLVLDPEV